MAGIPAAELSDADLERELAHAHAHEKRHDTFLHGSDDALRAHTERTGELEAEFVRRHPQRQVDLRRTREGRRD